MTIDHARGSAARVPHRPDSPPSLCHAFQHWVAQIPDAPALRNHDGSQALTWGEYGARARRVAAGLHALGVRRGDTLAIMLSNRVEFNVVDAGAIHLGAVPFSIYNSLPAAGVAYAIEHAQANVVVTEPRFLPTVLAARSPVVRHVVVVGDAPPGTVSLAEVEATRPSSAFDFDATWQAIGRDDPLTLIYTSGTTGQPKAVELTHDSLLAYFGVLPSVLGDIPPHSRVLSWLPSAHVADRALSHFWAIAFGSTLTAVSDMALLPQVMMSVHPTILSTVPRLWEKLKAGLEAAGVTDPRALDPAARQAALARLGLDEAKLVMCGSAPIGPDVLEYFMALGLPIVEGWGMSETGIGILNPPNAPRVGTIGKPMPGLEVRVAVDGELLVRGPQVFKRYRNDPAKTEEAFDSEGWLRTGDLVAVDADGYFSIVGRKKEIIINAAGKNIAPNPIEAQIRASDALIGQAIVIGDRRPYVVALLVLEPAAADKWEREQASGVSRGSRAADPMLRRRLSDALARVNEGLARVEQVKRFAILDGEWLPGSDELTPTAKLKRNSIESKYRTLIDAMFEDPAYGL